MKVERDVSLDAMRGIAALAVFGWHGLIGFFPDYSGYVGSAPIEHSARSQFWFVAFNGAGAVAFFFVLSGFVLSRACLTTGDIDILVRGAVKRWPRLAGPALVATLASWLLFATGAYFFAPAATLVHSAWLAHFGGAYPDRPFEPSFASASLQGALLTFLRGDNSYDSSLWTMAYEFYGSVMVYALGFLLAQRPAARVRAPVIAAATAACLVANPVLSPFMVGFALAAFLPRRGLPAPAALWAAAVVAALLACGYTEGAGGFYGVLTAHWPAWLPIPLFYAAAAAALIAAAESWPGMNALLSRPWGRLCGELSFPFYLVHLLALCSAGAFTLIATGSKPLALAATLAVSLAGAWLLALLNRWWMARLNSGVATLLASLARRRPERTGAIASQP